jgi:hypothetical protein
MTSSEAATPQPSAPGDLVDRIGAVAAGEFDRVPEFAKPRLMAWIERLPTLSDRELFEECESAIFGSASVARFRGNFEEEHCQASACYHEAERRLVAAGHREGCGGPSVYSRAHARIMRSHGYTPTPDGTCECFEQGGG